MIVLLNAQSDFVPTILNKLGPLELEGQGGITDVQIFGQMLHLQKIHFGWIRNIILFVFVCIAEV